MGTIVQTDLVESYQQPPKSDKTGWLRQRAYINEMHLMALISFISYVALGVYLTFHMHYYSADSISRVANAYYVLFSRDPHLGAIGFVWNPLPSIFELPFVALKPIWPALVTKAFAGDIVSAVFGTIGVMAFMRILANFYVPKIWRICLVFTYAFNPLIALYAANGMSDLMFVSCVLASFSGVLDYTQTKSLRRLTAAAFWIAVGFGMRYGAVPFGAFMIIGLIIGLWGQVKPSHWVGAAILLGAPIVYAGGLWMYFSWLIMKNPLYFLDSSYGNLAQTATGAYVSHSTTLAMHSVLGTLLYVERFTLLFWPINIGILLTLVFVFGKYRDSRAPVLLAGTLGAVTLELAFIYKGNLAPWDRFYISFIPDGMILCAFAFSKLVGHQNSFRKHVVWIMAVVVFLSGDIGTVLALQTKALGNPDGPVVDLALKGKIASANPFNSSRAVVSYLDGHPDLTVLVDTFKGWSIVIRASHLHQFIIDSEPNFQAVLHNPKGQVDAFLVPKPVGVSKLDAINRTWPGMWAGHVRWAILIKAFPAWRLYAVTHTAP